VDCTGEIGHDNTSRSGTGSTGTAGTGTGTSTGTSTGTGSTMTGSTGSTGTGGSGQWQPEACNMAKASFASGRIWQISDEQYWNAVRDILGVVPPTGTEAEISGAINTTGEFTNLSDAAPGFTDMLAQNYQSAAQKVATQVTAAVKMTALLGAPATAPATAAQFDTFLNGKVARLWRRPLSPGEMTALKNIYNGGTNAADGGPANAFGLLIQAVLQAPSFLFRTELGPGTMAPATAPFHLTPYELATAVSFMFTNSVPDDMLWSKAADGTLVSPDVLGTQVDRLMATPVTQTLLTNYLATYLWIARVPSREKDYTLFPEYTNTVRQAVYESGLAFVRDIVNGGTISDLFTSTKIHVNKDLSTVYGIPGGTGAALTAVNSALPERSGGILTHPALLAATDKRPGLADPVHHGLFILEEILNGGDVGEIPGAPPDALAKAAMMRGDERKLVEIRAMTPPCAGCHSNFDGFGLTRYSYDTIGRYNPNKYVAVDLDVMPAKYSWATSPMPLDNSTTIPEQVGPDLKGPIADSLALAKLLNTDGVRRRVAYAAGKFLAIYAIGHDAGVENSCALQTVKEHFYTTGSFKTFYRDLVTSTGFVGRDSGK